MIKSRRKIDAEAVLKYNAEAKDWTGNCRVCGAKLTGTLEELKAHRCKIDHEG